MYATRRTGSSYIQGDLGAVKVASTGDGGVYLGASSQYPGSISSVDVDMSGTGNTVVATSNGDPDLAVIQIAIERQHTHIAGSPWAMSVCLMM